MLPSERTAHGRAGDPALASRMSHLESMLRRLVASPLHRLDTEEAPAGPGVFLLSFSIRSPLIMWSPVKRFASASEISLAVPAARAVAPAKLPAAHAHHSIAA